MKNQEPNLTDHEYDGIQEFDNPLPNWWLMTFIGTVIFAFLYYIHFELGGGGPSMKNELASAMAVIEAQKSQAATKELSPEELLAQLKDPSALVTPDVVASYKGKCAACHGAELQGLIGPNLTDEFWIHGKGGGLDIIKLIKEGVPAKGMPPWGAVLSENEVLQLTAYIMAQQDSHPAAAKAPQGEKVR